MKTVNTESQIRSHKNKMPYLLWLCVLKLESIKHTANIDLNQNY